MASVLRPTGIASRLIRVSQRAPIQTRGIASTVKSILHGSPAAKKEGELEVQQHSRLVGRGKYIHSFETHRVKPDQLDAYKKAAEKFYAGVATDPTFHVKLTGSWETVIGELDTFVHILEYENYGGYDKSTQLIRESHFNESFAEMLPHIQSRSSQLCQEFAFLPSSPPRSLGGIFELRSYTLVPGKLLEWETAWRSGIEARSSTIQPVGAWFSQVGRLHQVHHLWQYENMESRKEKRETAWQTPGWSDTVHKTGEHAITMDTSVMLPLSFSPLK